MIRVEIGTAGRGKFLASSPFMAHYSAFLLFSRQAVENAIRRVVKIREIAPFLLLETVDNWLYEVEKLAAAAAASERGAQVERPQIST